MTHKFGHYAAALNTAADRHIAQNDWRSGILLGETRRVERLGATPPGATPPTAVPDLRQRHDLDPPVKKTSAAMTRFVEAVKADQDQEATRRQCKQRDLAVQYGMAPDRAGKVAPDRAGKVAPDRAGKVAPAMVERVALAMVRACRNEPELSWICGVAPTLRLRWLEAAKELCAASINAPPLLVFQNCRKAFGESVGEKGQHPFASWEILSPRSQQSWRHSVEAGWIEYHGEELGGGKPAETPAPPCLEEIACAMVRSYRGEPTVDWVRLTVTTQKAWKDAAAELQLFHKEDTSNPTFIAQKARRAFEDDPLMTDVQLAAHAALQRWRTAIDAGWEKLHGKPLFSPVA